MYHPLKVLSTNYSMVCKNTNNSSIAVSQAGKRGELLSKIPSKEGNEQVQWIWTGMLIELEQYVVFPLQGFSSPFHICRHRLKLDIHKLGRHPSSKEQAQIQDRWESLQTKIEAFHQRGLQIIRSDEASIADLLLSGRGSEVIGLDLEESDEEAFFLDDGSEWEERDVEVLVEKVRLWLPSSFAASRRAQMGLEQVAGVEAELQAGQANDALEAFRAGLAEKSLRFQTEVKPAKSQKATTRAWDSIHRADKEIQQAVQCYWLA